MRQATDEDPPLISTTSELEIPPCRLSEADLARFHASMRARFPLRMDPEEPAARLPEDGYEALLEEDERLLAALASPDQRRILWVGPERLLVTHLAPCPGYLSRRADVADAFEAFRALIGERRCALPVLTYVNRFRLPLSEGALISAFRRWPGATEVGAEDAPDRPGTFELPGEAGERLRIIVDAASPEQDEGALTVLEVRDRARADGGPLGWVLDRMHGRVAATVQRALIELGRRRPSRRPSAPPGLGDRRQARARRP